YSLDATALISVSEYDNIILKAIKENEFGYIEGITNNKYPFMRRQDLPKTYMSNGAMYIIKVDKFLENNSFFTDNTI
ncbi:acylneuraminate cytidylyltransferase family protein, partial [Aliarcobacter butzleri]